MSDDVVQTHIRKITIGTPLRKVTGAEAQTLGDLTDVNLTGLKDKGIIQYDAATGKWVTTTAPTGLVLSGGQF